MAQVHETTPVDARESERRQTRGEEVANSLTHGLGFVLSVAGAPLLITAAVQRGTIADVVAASVFAATMAFLYLGSTLYHAMPHGRAKDVFHVLDHAAIYLLIAGTYTPFTLGVLSGAWGWTLFGIVWGLAAFGVLFKTFGGFRWPGVSTAVYVGMGWLILIAAKPLWDSLPLAGLLWLLAGGLAYTAGVGFYVTKRMPYGHTVWHLFVLTGTACHFVAVLRYAI